jgi:L-lactate dehydrogenase (cytochrome)
MSIITNIEDLRRIARRKLPRVIYDYVEHGSYDELTLKANRDDLDAIRLLQRVLIDVSKVSLATSMLGEPVSMPLAIAPTGLAGLVHGDGEMLAARAAEAAGIKFCLSTMSICSIEDRAELEVAMTLAGLRDIREVSRAVVA